LSFSVVTRDVAIAKGGKWSTPHGGHRNLFIQERYLALPEFQGIWRETEFAQSRWRWSQSIHVTLLLCRKWNSPQKSKYTHTHTHTYTHTHTHTHTRTHGTPPLALKLVPGIHP
jgi:hypothetical protein